MVYTQTRIQEIVEYARLRGIRTLVEFDTPGHTRSWGISHPEILTACEGVYTDKLGPIDPSRDEAYTFMEQLLAEIVRVFPDEYVHLGGDEGISIASKIICVDFDLIVIFNSIQLALSAGHRVVEFMSL